MFAIFLFNILDVDDAVAVPTFHEERWTDRYIHLYEVITNRNHYDDTEELCNSHDVAAYLAVIVRKSADLTQPRGWMDWNRYILVWH